jgi:RNA polymerase sigma-70 factor (ECF subfamily)
MEDLETIIGKAQRGDIQAFGQIYQLFYKRIFRFCQIHLESEETAADICQETFIKAWKALPGFSLSKGGSLQAYLFKIARNLLIDQSRKKREVKLEVAEEAETHEDFVSQVDSQEEEKKLHNALDKLTIMDRQIVILRYFEDLSFTEISQATGVKEGALRVRTNRALKKLKEILDPVLKQAKDREQK